MKTMIFQKPLEKTSNEMDLPGTVIGGEMCVISVNWQAGKPLTATLISIPDSYVRKVWAGLQEPLTWKQWEDQGWREVSLRSLQDNKAAT